MPTPPAERRLAAILAADVVGYSRLMGADEVGTLRALKALHADLLEPMIEGHRGRVVKTAGDGLLAEFASIVDAVACAAGVQREMAGQAASGGSPRLTLRIGLNLGDVIIDGEDIFGDGVNVAARLEAICEPGGLAMSRAAHDQVRDKLDLPFVDRGEQQVKNIARPVQVFGIGPRALADLPESALASPMELPPRPRPRVATPRRRSAWRKWRIRAILAVVAIFALWHREGVRHAVDQIVAWAMVKPDKPMPAPDGPAPKPAGGELAPLPAPIVVQPAPGSPPDAPQPPGPEGGAKPPGAPVQLHPDDP
jgi:class 3 adenylate cyclase